MILCARFAYLMIATVGHVQRVKVLLSTPTPPINREMTWTPDMCVVFTPSLIPHLTWASECHCRYPCLPSQQRSAGVTIAESAT